MSAVASDTPLGELETVATFSDPMPTGVTVSHSGRIFVCYPKWGDDVPATVTEVRDGQAAPSPYSLFRVPIDARTMHSFTTCGGIRLSAFK